MLIIPNFTFQPSELKYMEDQSRNDSGLYSEDLAPIPVDKRTWNRWNLAALWVGMAVCIPTYLLASYMIRSGLSWQAALLIIGLANLVITLPMVLNGHAGVKYGIPFPVAGRSAFGIYGIHIPAIIRGFVACGWFGIQTWIGGLAIYSIWNALSGNVGQEGLSIGKFAAFGVFWFINIYFIWKGTESIKWLEDISAPILIGIGLVLIYWAHSVGDGFSKVLDAGKIVAQPTVILDPQQGLVLKPLESSEGNLRAAECKLIYNSVEGTLIESDWMKLKSGVNTLHPDSFPGMNSKDLLTGQASVSVTFKARVDGHEVVSSEVKAITAGSNELGLWSYLLWFTSMVGFWATMSISISDITRFAKSQKDQISGQFIGLPGTMIFYSFTGIFVTCAAVLAFPDVLVAEDAPWDPVSLINRFKNPGVIIFAQIAMLIATLSTNIAANVIAPANAISNVFPRHLSFRMGGVLAGLTGVALCPWWLMDDISSLLIFISGLLGPVLAVLLCDYFLIRKTQLDIESLYQVKGLYYYSGGYNLSALFSIFAGAMFAVSGKWIPAMEWAFSMSWFSGFIFSFVLYYLFMQFTKSKKS